MICHLGEEPGNGLGIAGFELQDRVTTTHTAAGCDEVGEHLRQGKYLVPRLAGASVSERPEKPKKRAPERTRMENLELLPTEVPKDAVVGDGRGVAPLDLAQIGDGVDL